MDEGEKRITDQGGYGAVEIVDIQVGQSEIKRLKGEDVD
jgi:hypothetical protein